MIQTCTRTIARAYEEQDDVPALLDEVEQDILKVSEGRVESGAQPIKELVKKAIATLPNVDVEAFDGLTVDFARERGALAMVRGLRISSDFEREFDMAMMNRKMSPGLEVVCLMASPEYQFLSSSLLKEAASLGGKIEDLVTRDVAEALEKKKARFGLEVTEKIIP